MLKFFFIDGRFTLPGTLVLVLVGFALAYMSLEFLASKWLKLIGLSLGLSIAAVGGFSGRASAIGLPPPFTDDPLGWRAAKKSYDENPDQQLDEDERHRS